MIGRIRRTIAEGRDLLAFTADALRLGAAIQVKATHHAMRGAPTTGLPTFTVDTWLRQVYEEAGVEPPFGEGQ